MQLGDRIDKVSWFSGTEDASIVRSIESVFGLAAGTRFLLRDEDGTLRSIVCLCAACMLLHVCVLCEVLRLRLRLRLRVHVCELVRIGVNGS